MKEAVNLAGKKIVVVGLGRTGMAVARFLDKMEASVIVTDTADKEDLGVQLEIIRQLGIDTELGRHRTETFKAADMVVVSPGVSHKIDPILKARHHGVQVIGEVELASRFIREPIVAVTGTNGKTTTTELIGAMLKSSGRKVFVGGNIGNPLISYVEKAEIAEVVVAEISSFQLDTMETFRPKVSVLLNISVDHLDRYPDFDAYANTKIRIFENQQADDIAVLNGSDARVRKLTQHIKSSKLIYPNPLQNEEGAILQENRIILKLEAGKTRNFQICNPESEIRKELSVDTSTAGFRGRHNLENACAAALATLAAGGNLGGIQNALDLFQGSAHRLELIDSIDDVQYFNDSKATNVDAVARALACFSKPVVLIMGGRNKGGDFRELKDFARQHVKALIVMGESANTIRSALADVTSVKSASSMDDAVRKARQAANPGDVVLLSPGCASFDMYDSYVRRGEDFHIAVKKLKE